MCNYVDLIRKTDDGYLLHSKECDSFQLGFGTTVISTDRAHLEALYQELERQLTKWNHKIPTGEKAFFFATNSHNVKFVLCYKELESLYELLSQSFLILQAQDIMDSPSTDEF